MQQKSEKMLLGLLLALMMVIGLLPCMSLTAYADSADIGVGTTWYVGDTINLGGKYFVKYYHPTTGEPSVYQSKDEGNEVPDPDLIYDGKQWRFRECVKTTSFSELHNISVIRPDDKDASEKPIGFKIKSGDGTQNNPYTFELVYAPKINVSLDKTTLSMVVDTNSNGEILTATVSSDETIDKTVEWSSSDDTVVQAKPNSNLGDDGYQNLCYVRALKAGTSTITVTATNGTENTSDDKTATCTVKVYDPYPIGTVWHLGDTINLHGAWYLAQNNDQYEQHSKDEDSVVPTSPQLYDAVAVFSEFIPVSGEVSVAGGELLPYTDGRKGTLRIDIPADKKGKTPSGIKLVEGKGTILHPYEFELVFENAPTPSKPVSIANAKVVLSASSFAYNGKVRKPSIKTIGGKTLKSGTDYTVKWSNTSSKNVGSYTVTITGKGNYTGVTKVTYKINPKGTSLKKPKRAKKAVTVKWKKQSAKMAKSRITGYQIQLATDKKFTKNRKTVNVKGYKKVSKKVKKLKAKKKYYIRVRTYKTVSGIKYYSGWSKVKAAKTR